MSVEDTLRQFKERLELLDVEAKLRLAPVLHYYGIAAEELVKFEGDLRATHSSRQRLDALRSRLLRVTGDLERNLGAFTQAVVDVGPEGKQFLGDLTSWHTGTVLDGVLEEAAPRLGIRDWHVRGSRVTISFLPRTAGGRDPDPDEVELTQGPEDTASVDGDIATL